MKGKIEVKTDYRVCSKCKAKIKRNILDENYSICPECGNYMRIHARKRIKMLADDHSFKEWKIREKIFNPLDDSNYEEKFKNSRIQHDLNDAIIDGEIEISGIKVAIGVMDTRFMMASMGHIVGERITHLFEIATRKKIPVVLFCCSGGARMQEGIISLMQMEKTAAAVKRHSQSGGLYVSILTNPTMGGVTASFAMLADVIIAEKGAMIGFAGSRVIEQNTKQKLPDGFQTAEFQKEHGYVDEVIERKDIKRYLSHLLKLHSNRGGKLKRNDLKRFNYNMEKINRTPWERVKIARANSRPTCMDYVNMLFDGFVELHGDRIGGDDHAIVAGIAYFHGCPITIIGHQKGKDSIEDAIYRNWGMPVPQGYRKVLRLMKQAEKFKRPVICFVDTIGAACGIEAEENGQGIAIAELLQEASSLRTPILSIIIGEGGSGGALALAIGNEVWILENAIYSILTPESYASILWKDNEKAPEAAKKMKLEAEDLYKLKIVDKVIGEGEPITSMNMTNICIELENNIMNFLLKYKKKNVNSIVNERYRRFRKY